MQLNTDGILDKYNIELIGANIEAIQKAENREKFKKCMDGIGIPTAKGGFVNSYDDAITLVEKYGAKSSTSISKKTDFVVVGENAGSKLEKAKEKNITILNESTFLDFLNSN